MGLIVSTLFVALLAALFFMVVPARAFAGIIRIIVPGMIATFGLALLALGRPLVGGLTIFGAVLTWRALRRRNSKGSGPEQITSRTVRSAAFEVEFSHSGEISNGVVLAGRFEGRVLDDMSRADLLRLRSEIDTDFESLELLDAYLDGRFPRWREDAHLDGSSGK